MLLPVGRPVINWYHYSITTIHRKRGNSEENTVPVGSLKRENGGKSSICSPFLIRGMTNTYSLHFSPVCGIKFYQA